MLKRKNHYNSFSFILWMVEKMVLAENENPKLPKIQKKISKTIEKTYPSIALLQSFCYIKVKHRNFR